MQHYRVDTLRIRSAAMLYKVRSYLMHSLYGALPGQYVPARVTRGPLLAHRYTYAQPRSTAGLLFPCKYLCGTILLTPYSMVWDWRVSSAGPLRLYWLTARSLFVSNCFIFSFFHLMGWYCGVGVIELIGC